MLPFCIDNCFIMTGYLLNIFDPESLIRNGRLLLVFLIVFGQTGLFFCFFLPAGAAMFATGVFAATGNLHQNIFFVCGLLVAASVLGNITGYWFGRKAGLLLYKREDSKFFRMGHLRSAEEFYKKYGWLALIGGLFLPITRTFAPIVAGMVKLNFRDFIIFILAGSVLWVLSFVLAGYFIGNISFLKEYINYFVITIVFVITIPVVYGIVKKLRKLNK